MQLFRTCRAQSVHIRIGGGQRPGGLLAHVTDAERANKPLQGRFLFGALQGIHKLGGEFYTHPLIMQEFRNSEGKEVGGGAHAV